MSKLKCEDEDLVELSYDRVDDANRDNPDSEDEIADISHRIFTDFNPLVHPFSGESHVIFPEYLTSDSVELDYFEIYADSDCMEKIAKATNLHYHQKIDGKNLKSQSKYADWPETNIEEMYTFFGLIMLMTRNRRLFLHEYWSIDPMLHNPTFSQTMPRDRFRTLWKLLAFDELHCDTVRGKEITKITSLANFFKARFKTMFAPCENLKIEVVTIGEKNKQSTVIVYLLIDIHTGYIVDFIFKNDMKKPSYYVLELLKDFLGKGYKVWMDESITNVKLFEHLHSNKVNVCGSASKDTKGMPYFNDLEDGEVEIKSHGPILFIKWQDKKDFYMITTMHDASMVNSVEECVEKPLAYMEYKEFTKISDSPDIKMSTMDYLCSNSLKFKRAAFYLFDMIIINAYTLYKTVTENELPLAAFHLSLIRQLLIKYRCKSIRTVALNVGLKTTTRLTAKDMVKHMPSLIPQKGKRGHLRRRCRVCSQTTIRPKSRKSTRYYCSECNVALCIIPCFKEYHGNEVF